LKPSNYAAADLPGLYSILVVIVDAVQEEDKLVTEVLPLALQPQP